jgi:vacuolar-type H+-ATPase subunit E/Vma4
MGYRELIASLRIEGEEKMKTIRDNARAEAEELQARAAKKIGQLRKEYKVKEDEIGKAQEDDVLSKARNKARIIKLESEKSLSDRLLRLALPCLPELRNDRYEAVFALMKKELPETLWEEVIVNPEDVHIARTLFPGSEITSDDGIAGGLEVLRESRKQHIINTFEKRLERAWENILPLMVIDAHKEAFKHGTPSEH